MTRRSACLIALTLAVASLGGRRLAAQGVAYDVLIRGAQVVDGTGNPYFYGDVAVKGGRIAAVGRLPNATATRIIDATGLVVTPGFTDLHTHSDWPLYEDGTAQSKIRQGVASCCGSPEWSSLFRTSKTAVFVERPLSELPDGRYALGAWAP